MPLERQVPPVSEAEPSPRPAGGSYRWYRIASSVLFIVFCMEVGLFLVIFPWSDYWELNFFSSVIPEWRRYWDNSYLRGAVSGLGVVNLYISLTEILRLLKFTR